jgi:hypothetical protein
MMDAPPAFQPILHVCSVTAKDQPVSQFALLQTKSDFVRTYDPDELLPITSAMIPKIIHKKQNLKLVIPHHLGLGPHGEIWQPRDDKGGTITISYTATDAGVSTIRIRHRGRWLAGTNVSYRGQCKVLTGISAVELFQRLPR